MIVINRLPVQSFGVLVRSDHIRRTGVAGSLSVTGGYGCVLSREGVSRLGIVGPAALQVDVTAAIGMTGCLAMDNENYPGVYGRLGHPPMEATMMQTATPGSPDAIATAADLSAPIERRFEAVVNFADTGGVGDCMLALNKRGFVYTNSIAPIDEDEHVVSGTISGAIELAAGEAEEAIVDQVFDLVGQLVEPFGGECPECRLVDRQAPHTEATGSGLTPSLF
jgi:hypothetical protein